MTRLAAALLLSLGLLVPLVHAAPAAQAASGVVADPRDDDLPATLDVRSLRAEHGRTRVTATIELERLVPDLSNVFLILSTGETEYAVGNRASGERHRTVFVRFTDDGRTPVRCRSLDVDLDRRTDRVGIAFDRSCLADAGRSIRFVGFTESPRSQRDADITRPLRLTRG